jgi:hypothetical protein
MGGRAIGRRLAEGEAASAGQQQSEGVVRRKRNGRNRLHKLGVKMREGQEKTGIKCSKFFTEANQTHNGESGWQCASLRARARATTSSHLRVEASTTHGLRHGQLGTASWAQRAPADGESAADLGRPWPDNGPASADARGRRRRLVDITLVSDWRADASRGSLQPSSRRLPDNCIKKSAD